MLPTTVSAIAWPEYWQVDQQKKTVTLLGTGSNRTRRLSETLVAEHKQGTFQQLKRWTGEIVSVYGPSKEVVLSIEKLAAPLFGIITYGVQLLAYRDDDDNSSSLKLWIARRAKTKRTFPGMLDSTVGGSLTTGETPFECLVRESAEGVSGVRSLQVSFCRLYSCFDAHSFEPRCRSQPAVLTLAKSWKRHVQPSNYPL